MVQVNVSMVTSVHLLTPSQRFLLSLLISLKEILTFICSILSQYGALTMKLSIKETHVYLLIIGKTSEESRSSIFTQKSNALTGAQDSLLVATEMDAKMSFYALIVMVGKSRSIILTTLS